MFYMRVLGMHTNSTQGNSFIADENSYWLLLGLLQVGYFILSWFRYFLLNIVILYSNEKLHELMIEGLVRSPTSYFDVTPSGRLINAFSNDLGLLDMTLAFSFTDMIEGPIISISMLINIFTIELYFIPPGVANIVFLVLFFVYAKRPIVECRQLYLKLRTPVFSYFGEMLAVLTQIAAFGTRRPRLERFARAADLSTKTNISFNVVSRGFGVYISYVSSMILIIGFFIGVYFISASEAGNYGVTIILLTSISDYLQYFLKQIITV
jgi:ATP-binding cassette, subfamily C (CFTR/MRP), member 4